MTLRTNKLECLFFGNFFAPNRLERKWLIIVGTSTRLQSQAPRYAPHYVQVYKCETKLARINGLAYFGAA